MMTQELLNRYGRVGQTPDESLGMDVVALTYRDPLVTPAWVTIASSQFSGAATLCYQEGNVVKTYEGPPGDVRFGTRSAFCTNSDGSKSIVVGAMGYDGWRGAVSAYVWTRSAAVAWWTFP